MPAPVEVTTKYATSVDDLAAAWAFVMSKVDTVGPSPSITISPYWQGSVQEALDDPDAREWPRRFEVVVSGMIHEKESN